MLRMLSSTFKVSLAIMFALLSSGVLTILQNNQAYASLQGNPQPVFCHDISQPGSNVWDAQQGSGTGEERFPLTGPVAGLEVDKDYDLRNDNNQVYVPNMSNKSILDTACQEQYGEDDDESVNYCNPAPAVGSVADWVPANVDCVTFTVAKACGVLDAQITNLTPFKSWAVSWSEKSADYNYDTSLPATFPEDHNGGSVDVYYWLTGPEEDYLTGRTDIPSYWGHNAGMVTVDTDCVDPPVTLVECEAFPRIHATNKDPNGWTLDDNASFVDGGMKLDVTGGWDTTTITRTLSGELKDLGTGIDFAPEDQYLGLHVKTSAGTLTYEKYYENQDPANTGKWWSESNFNVASGQGYVTFDTLENIVAANPGVTLENLRVLYTHPNPSSVVVTSVKIGCNEFTFHYERIPQVCTVKSNTYSDTWDYDEYTYPEADDYSGITNNATFTFTDEGLHISTPTTPDYVFGLFDGGNTALADIDAIGYDTFRKEVSAGYGQTLPAYLLYVDLNGDAPDGETYLWYEPYYNGAVVEGEWQTWDALDNGNAKWYMSGTEQKLQAWNYFVSEYPDAVVLAYGFNQGTYNAETHAIIQDMVFDCATTHFSAPRVLGDDDQNPVNTVADLATVIVPATVAVLPAQLPATGSQGNSNQIGMLIAIVLGSLTYFLALRRQTSDQ